MGTDQALPREAQPPSAISVEICPHCGASQVGDPVMRTGGISRCRTVRWEIKWACGSTVMIAGSHTRLSLSKKCNPGLDM
jgi:hypothetical protein